MYFPNLFNIKGLQMNATSVSFSPNQSELI